MERRNLSAIIQLVAIVAGLIVITSCSTGRGDASGGKTEHEFFYDDFSSQQLWYTKTGSTTRDIFYDIISGDYNIMVFEMDSVAGPICPVMRSADYKPNFSGEYSVEVDARVSLGKNDTYGSYGIELNFTASGDSDVLLISSNGKFELYKVVDNARQLSMTKPWTSNVSINPSSNWNHIKIQQFYDRLVVSCNGAVLGTYYDYMLPAEPFYCRLVACGYSSTPDTVYATFDNFKLSKIY